MTTEPSPGADSPESTSNPSFSPAAHPHTTLRPCNSWKNLYFWSATFTIAIVIAADALLKLWTHTHLPLLSSVNPIYPYGGVGVFRNIGGIEFSLAHATNKGAAWSVGSDYAEWLLALRLVFIAALALYIVWGHYQRRLTVPLALILSGAVANVLDFFFYGHVIDMFHFVLWGYSFPIFNIADSAIFCGVVAIMILGDDKARQAR